MTIESKRVSQQNIAALSINKVTPAKTEKVAPAAGNNPRALPVDRINMEHDVSTLVEKTFSRIKDIDALISDGGDIVIVCGDTGSGKSTLINLLAGQKLVAVKPENSRKLRIECHGGGGVTTIGHTLVSETTTPSKVQIGGTIYWDCPGFNDSRGPIIDISNAFYINKLLTSPDKVKMMIVADESSINGANRGQAFKGLVSRLGELFENKENLVDSLCLVFTKVRDIDDFRSELSEIVDSDMNLKAGDRALLQAIISRSKIVNFELPLKAGPISGKTKDVIMSEIAKAKFISKPQVNITVSKDSLIILSRLVGEVDKKVGELSGALCDKVLYKLNSVSATQVKAIQTQFNAYTAKSAAESKNQSYAHKIDNMKSGIFNTILAMPEFAEVRDGISQNLSDLKKFAVYFDDFFMKIIPGCSINEANLQKAFVGLNTAIQMHSVQFELKDNKEALGKAQRDITANAAAHMQELTNLSNAHKQQMDAQNARIAQLAQELNNATAEASRANAAAAESARVSAAQIAGSNAQMATLMKEMAERPTEVHHHHYESSDDDGCMIQ